MNKEELKGFITSELHTITYKGKEYPIKMLTNADEDTDFVATEELIDSFDEDVDNWGDEERSIDEMMCAYLNEEDFNASDDELAVKLYDMGCYIADPNA